jgi:hypothetical protein
MEIALRRLDGVNKIHISIRDQRFEITYKPGATFQPEDIREAVARAEVDVLRFRINARGRVHEEGGNRIFIAGKDNFLLVDSPKIPSERPISIEGTVDDFAAPLRLTIVQFKPLK